SLTVGAVLTGAFLLVALVSLFYTPYDPNLPDIPSRLLSPGSPEHLLGADGLGRDVIANLMAGARTSVIIGASGSLLGMILGLVGGLIAAVGRRWSEESIMRLADMLIAIPGIITALVLATSIGAGAFTTIIALSLF